MHPVEKVIADIAALLASPPVGDGRLQAIAEFIRSAREYRWVGLYEVTSREIRAIGWTGNVAPEFPRFPTSKGLCGAAVKSRKPVVGDVKK